MNNEIVIEKMIIAVEEIIKNNMRDQFDLTKQSSLVKTVTKEIIKKLDEATANENN